MKLNESSVCFNQEAHTYTLDGKELSGVTSLLDRQIFKNKYTGVSETVLNKAANRGSLIHETIELVDGLGIESDLAEVQAYIALKKQHGLNTHANEYLVSDNDHVASSIDIVFDDCSLADIKTTSHLDRDYVSWQLSIYAYLFELQNPGLKANKLYAIWLPQKRYGKPALVEVERKSTELVQELIECDKRGEEFMLPDTQSSQELQVSADVIDEVANISRQMKEMKARYEELQQGLLELMKQSNVKSFKCDRLSLSYKEPSTRMSIDSKLLESKYPQIYEECLKESIVKESITIKTA